MAAYYNEHDPYPAQWIRNLIKAGLIPDGDVDERSITDVAADDVRGYRQCHFFAGIGVWSHSLRLAGWDDDRAVWTGSCPCQPFSVAGKRAGFDDERHLWPAWFKLIAQCRPGVVFGEQVSSKDAVAWIDAVFDDMEAAGYACGAVDLPACGVGAPHIRQRHFWLADSDHQRCGEAGRAGGEIRAGGGGSLGVMADAGGAGLQERERFAGIPGWPVDADQGQAAERGSLRPTGGFWRAADWLWCRDEKHRPVEPGARPLAHGATGRVGRLRAYGNAINAQAAAEVIAAFMAVRP
jgi:DNA (cytosine-5)-methyltransferase 1